MEERLAVDLKLGAGQIAEEVLGENTPENRRKIYHLHETGALPTFKFGNQLALRPSTLKKVIADRERAAMTSATADPWPKSHAPVSGKQ
jgi:hypothetical protein